MIRHELIAMHFAGAPQVYPVCIQANVESSGTFVATDTVTFPEAYHSESLSLDYETFNVNQSDTKKFTCPGPAVVNFSSGGQAAAPAASAASASDPPAASPSGDAEPVPASVSPDNSANAGKETDIATAPGSAPVYSDASALPSASAEVSAYDLPAQSSVVLAATGTGTGAASTSATRGRGRHSGRPRHPR